MTQANFGDGEAFVCQKCGECCSGRGGIVLGPRDRERISRELGLDEAVFLERYAEHVSGKWRLRVGDDEMCIFFQDRSGCSIHQIKPLICRAWPFFRGNLLDAESWTMAQDACPGIQLQAGHAAFQRQGLAYLREQGLVEEADDAASALKV